jgi:predicted GNAT family acetyltransferase
MDTPEHVSDGHRGAFVIKRGERQLATLTYTLAGDNVIIDHTEVDSSLRGTGAGAKLVAAAVNWARGEHRLIIPLCPFAKSVFDKTPKYSDVLSA